MSYDTLPEARDVRLQALASSTPEERLRGALELSDFVRGLSLLGEQHRASRDDAGRQLPDERSR